MFPVTLSLAWYSHHSSVTEHFDLKHMGEYSQSPGTMLIAGF